MVGTLYVVATPIGNLADVTLRALSTLREVDLIAAEDTRVTRKLLTHYGIDTPTTPYHQHNLTRKTEQILEALKAGKNIALVSDAGTPGISDPGYEIIRLAIANEIPVTAIPGPSAIINALVLSGLPTSHFAFEGFPPRRTGERRKYFASLKDDAHTLIFYESPNRLISMLEDMKEVLGDRRIAIIREATKVFEEVHRGNISTAIERFTKVEPKGEITIVIAGAEVSVKSASIEDIESTLLELIKGGMSDRDAVHMASKLYPIAKKNIYRLMIEMKRRSEDE